MTNQGRKMFPIICDNKPQTIVSKIQDYLKTGSVIKGMHIVDSNETQIVILVSDDIIDEKMASAWWSGYTWSLTN